MLFPVDVDFADIPANTVDETVAEPTSREIGKSLKFDYKTKQFIFVDGKNVVPSKIEAIKQWIELYIRTEINKYTIYTENFGVDLNDLIGYRLPRSYQVSEIMRRINTGILTQCPNVVRISDWNFDKGTFSFTVTTNTGEEVTISE